MARMKIKRPKTLVPNRPTAAGRALGVELARMTDAAEVETRQQFPHHAQRCQSCAFRAGTIPNGCPETVLEAMYAVVQQEPFYCHQRFDAEGHPEELCAGWAMAQRSLQATRLRAVPQISKQLRKAVAL